MHPVNSFKQACGQVIAGVGPTSEVLKVAREALENQSPVGAVPHGN